MSDNGSDLEFDNGDEEFRDHDDDGMEPMDHTERQGEFDYGHHIGREEDAEYDPDMSFERDVDTLLKVKAQIMFSLNKQRQMDKIPIFYEDLTLSAIAMQYASSLKSGSGDQAYLNRLNEQERFHMEYEVCELVSKYEEDVPITKKITQSFFIETTYLFLEMDNERQILMDGAFTHVGIGLAGNENNIVVVLLVTRKDLTILEISQTPQNVQVRGKILSPNHFVQLVEIYDSNYTEIAFSMYDKLTYDRQTKEFLFRIDVEPNWKERRWIQIYTSGTEHFSSKKPPKERKNKIKKDMNDKFLSLFMLYPDEQYLQCYKEQIEAEQAKQGKASGIIIDSFHKEQQVKEEVEQQSSSHEEEAESEMEEKEQVDLPGKDNKGSSNREIKEELTAALAEARNAHEGVLYTNQKLQGKIKEIREKNNISLDRANDGSMNEHKYLNILAQVHQTRVELQQTQDRYNRMSLELQTKLNEKQSKCNDIRAAFQDLKKQVAKKATYSRSDQPIKGYKIEEWQDREGKLTEQLQNLRLEILRARNALSKNQKILKKKEQLAEGLHLIDFEQLKIQNQTINQKIQERNEDLHKLKKKTTNMVQILTHTRQKMVFVEKMKGDLLETEKKLDGEIQKLRGDIGKIKQSCEVLRIQIQDAKQETQIINSQQLVLDFKKRAQNIQKLDEEMEGLLEREKNMKRIIEQYQRKIKKEAITH